MSFAAFAGGTCRLMNEAAIETFYEIVKHNWFLEFNL